MVSKRYEKANNPRVEGYDPCKPTNYLTSSDTNNLYRWVIRLPLPKSSVMPTEEQMMKMKETSRRGGYLRRS